MCHADVVELPGVGLEVHGCLVLWRWGFIGRDLHVYAWHLGWPGMPESLSTMETPHVSCSGLFSSSSRSSWFTSPSLAGPLLSAHAARAGRKSSAPCLHQSGFNRWSQLLSVGAPLELVVKQDVNRLTLPTFPVLLHVYLFALFDDPHQAQEFISDAMPDWLTAVTGDPEVARIADRSGGADSADRDRWGDTDGHVLAMARDTQQQRRGVRKCMSL